MGTSLIASLATHRSISHYVASLFAPKSHSSRREQNASLIAQSSSFFLLAQETTAFAHLLGGLGRGAGNPHPLLTTLIDVCLCKHQWRHLVPGFPASISEVPYYCHMQGEPYKTPATRSPTQKYQSIVTQKFTSQKYHILENVPVHPCYQIAQSY